jgi:hypothetical protein
MALLGSKMGLSSQNLDSAPLRLGESASIRTSHKTQAKNPYIRRDSYFHIIIV